MCGGCMHASLVKLRERDPFESPSLKVLTTGVHESPTYIESNRIHRFSQRTIHHT